jgi:hypothetical protein
MYEGGCLRSLSVDAVPESIGSSKRDCKHRAPSFLKLASFSNGFTPVSKVMDRHCLAEATPSTIALTARLIARNVKTSPLATSRIVLFKM